VEKYGRFGQATADNIIRHMRFACWIIKATSTHSEYVVLLHLHCNDGYANAPQCYIYYLLGCPVEPYTYGIKIYIILQYSNPRTLPAHVCSIVTLASMFPVVKKW
jgi:hypothetical protein